MPITGQPVFSAWSMTLTILAPCTSPSEPPNAVKSWLNTQTGRPSTRPCPVTTPSPYGRFAAMPKLAARCLASSSNSVNEPGSSSRSIRSLAVSLPRACCLATAFSEPAWMASCLRRSKSAILPAVVCRPGWAWLAGSAASLVMRPG